MGLYKPKFFQFLHIKDLKVNLSSTVELEYSSIMYYRADFSVTEVNFVSVLDIMGSIGGMFTFIMTVLGAILGILIESGWLRSILKEIVRD